LFAALWGSVLPMGYKVNQPEVLVGDPPHRLKYMCDFN